MTRREAFDAWCKDNDLKSFQAFSLAFVPASSGKKILRGVRNTASAQHRLYKLTELKELKLSKEQDKELAVLLHDPSCDEYWEEKVAELFISNWKADAKFPEPDDQVSISSENYKKIEVLLPTLVRKFFKQEIPRKVKRKTKVQNASVAMQPAVSVSEILEAFVSELEKVFKQNETEILVYARNNKTLLKKTGTLISVLLDENPMQASQLMKDTIELFSNNQTTTKYDASK